MLLGGFFLQDMRESLRYTPLKCVCHTYVMCSTPKVSQHFGRSCKLTFHQNHTETSNLNEISHKHLKPHQLNPYYHPPSKNKQNG